MTSLRSIISPLRGLDDAGCAGMTSNVMARSAVIEAAQRRGHFVIAHRSPR